MKYTINSIEHYPGTVHCKQGIKKNQLSKFAKNNRIVGGGNGSYLVSDESETIVSISDEKGKTHYINVFYPLKDMTDGKRFTKKFIDGLHEKIENTEFEVEEGESVHKNLNEILKKAL